MMQRDFFISMLMEMPKNVFHAINSHVWEEICCYCCLRYMAAITNPIEVHSAAERKIWILFADGVSGEVDLKHLSGIGIFKKWDESIPFDTVRINPENHAIVWDDELEIDSDNLYLLLIGKTFQEWREEHEPVYAAH